MSDSRPDLGPLFGWEASKIAAARLKRVRLAAKRRSKDVAADAGLRPARISEMETAGTRIRVADAVAVARVLGTTVDDLLPREVPR